MDWLLIETYKKGLAIFYYPAIFDSYGKEKLQELIVIDTYIWPNRKPTHWLPAPKPPIKGGLKCN